MFNLETFLEKKIFKSFEELCKYKSDDYRYHSRDEGIDEKYVNFTIERQRNGFPWAKLDFEKCTIGKYLRMAYDKLTPAQITHICEMYKAAVLEDSGTFKIIDGDDIKTTYYRTSYVPNHGTLSNSCMRYLKCQKHNFFQIYADHAKMLILTPKRGKRILGRAILWEYNGNYLMDRVYSAENFIEHQFYTYAKKMGYIVLDKNCYVSEGYHQKWLFPDDNYTTPKTADFEIQLNDFYDYYPFMDSFCYMSLDGKTLSSKCPNKLHYTLHCTSGGYYKSY